MAAEAARIPPPFPPAAAVRRHPQDRPIMSIAKRALNWLQSKPSVRYADAAPSDQTIVDIFAGEWLSALPNGLAGAPGISALFDDPRIRWLDQEIGLRDKSVLELGPLEGGHTAMMHAMGAKHIVAVEANERAFLKCLCIKEVCDLHRATFRFGDFRKYLDETSTAFDVIVASGVLYHMTEPLKLLSGLCARTDRLFLWTHYYDEGLRDRTLPFSAPETIVFEGRSYTGSRRLYPARAMRRKSYAGGSARHAMWLTRDSILDFLQARGFACVVGFEERVRVHGPAFAVVAVRDVATRPVMTSATSSSPPP